MSGETIPRHRWESRRIEIGLPLAIFAAIAGAALWLSTSLQREQLGRLDSETRVTAEQLRHRLDELIAAGALAVEHMAFEWFREHAERPQSFRDESRMFMKKSPGFTALIWVDEAGVVRATAPERNPVEFAGRSLLDPPDPDIAPALLRARDTGKISRTPVHDLIQGGPGFSMYLPIPDASGRRGGFIGATFQIDPLLSSVLSDMDLQTHFRFALRETDGTLVYSHDLEDPRSPRAHQTTLSVRAVDRPWTFEIEPAPLLIRQVDTRADEILLAGGLTLGVVVATLGYLLLLRQRRLRESENRYRDLFDNAPIPLWNEDFSEVMDFMEGLRSRGALDLRAHFQEHPEDLIECVRRVKILDLNRSAMELHGARTKQELLEGLDRIFTERSLEVFREELLAIFHGETHFESEAVVQTLGGEKRIVQLWLRTDTERARVQFSNIDITENRRASQELMRLGTAINQSTDAVLISNAAGELLYANDALYRMHGWKQEAVPSESVRSLAEQSGALEAYDEVDDQRNTWTHRYCLSDPDGVLVHREARSSPIRDETGRTTSVVTLIRDVTREAQLEAQMHHSQKLESLGVLAGGIAHDFNNLLVSILGNADLALRELPPSVLGRSHLEDVVGSAQRAADLCRQLLAYSGRGHFEVAPVDLSRVVTDMAHLLEVSVSKKARLQYDLGSDIPAVEADVTQLSQVILNLVTNASDAIRESGGAIRISTGARQCTREHLRGSFMDAELPEGLYAFVEVADTGCGMDEEVRARIFDPFYSTKFAGHGLGLAAVLGIVRGHRGAIQVESRPHLGSTFRLLLPASERTAVAAAVATGEADDAWRGKGTVLLVDDENTVRELAAKILRRAGFEVLAAVDGRAGVETLRRNAHKIDVVLLDMTMPRMGGEEAFREMRRIAHDVPIIVSSGYSERDATETFSQGGLAGFVQKPYTVAALLGAIRRALDPEGSDPAPGA